MGNNDIDVKVDVAKGKCEIVTIRINGTSLGEVFILDENRLHLMLHLDGEKVEEVNIHTNRKSKVNWCKNTRWVDLVRR